MSSSIGNFWTVPDALDELGVNVIRTFYAGAAYRSEQALTEETIAEAEERWERLSRTYDRAVEALDSTEARAKAEDEELRGAVETARDDLATAMNDDLNLREATAALLDLTDAVNRHVDDVEDGDTESAYDYRGLREAVEAFENLAGDVLGPPVRVDDRRRRGSGRRAGRPRSGRARGRTRGRQLRARRRTPGRAP